MADQTGHAIEVEGRATEGAAVKGSPVLGGAEARITSQTAVDDGDAVHLQADDQGRLIVTESPRDLVKTARIVLTSDTETNLVAATASEFHDMVCLILSNESATEVRVDIRDDTAATPVLSVDLAPDGGGAVLMFSTPFPQGATNDNWTAKLSTSVSSVYITQQTVTRL